jgi:hypothetical protein
LSASSARATQPTYFDADPSQRVPPGGTGERLSIDADTEKAINRTELFGSIETRCSLEAPLRSKPQIDITMSEALRDPLIALLRRADRVSLKEFTMLLEEVAKARQQVTDQATTPPRH